MLLKVVPQTGYFSLVTARVASGRSLLFCKLINQRCHSNQRKCVLEQVRERDHRQPPFPGGKKGASPPNEGGQPPEHRQLLPYSMFSIPYYLIPRKSAGTPMLFRRPPFRAPDPGGSPRPSPVIGWMGRGPPAFFDKLLVFASALCYNACTIIIPFVGNL